MTSEPQTQALSGPLPSDPHTGPFAAALPSTTPRTTVRGLSSS